jgi:hypothetical protein
MENKEIPKVDQNALDDIKKEADKLAEEFYLLNKDLQFKLNKISAISVCCTQTYKDELDKFCQIVDDDILLHENIIEKAKDLSASMKPIYQLQAKISQIKRLVDCLELLI